MTNAQAIALLAVLMAGRECDPRNFLGQAADLLDRAESYIPEPEADDDDELQLGSMTDVDWNPNCEVPF